MFPQILTTAWLTVFYWNNVSSQLLYENDRWNNELFRDSKEASKQYSQEKLEALLKEARLDSDIWRSRHEIVTESYNKLPKICKEHVRNGKFNQFCSNSGLQKVMYCLYYMAVSKCINSIVNSIEQS